MGVSDDETRKATLCKKVKTKIYIYSWKNSIPCKKSFFKNDGMSFKGGQTTKRDNGVKVGNNTLTVLHSVIM